MHAEAFARAATEDGRIERTGASSIHGLSVPGPEENVFRRHIAPDHQFRIVGGVLRQRFNFDTVPGTDLENRPQRTAEIAPMHVRRTDGEPMMRCFIPPVTGIGRVQDGGLANGAALLVLRIRQRAERPAALLGACALGELAGVLAAKRAGGRPETLLEQPVEIGGVGEAAAVGDVRDWRVRVWPARSERRARAPGAGLADSGRS